MKSISGIVIVAASLFGASNASLVPDTFEGCFTSTTGMSLLSTLNIVDPKYDRNFNSKGSCGGACNIGSYATYAMEDKDCYCGQKLPPTETETNSTNCNIQCPGYQTDGCGGAGFYSVYVTGLTSSVSNASPAASDTPAHTAPSSTSSAPPSKTTLPNSTIVVTASPSSTGTSSPTSKAKSGPSTVGIAVGVVVGLIAITAIAGGLWFFLRNKKRQELEEEHRRQAAVSQFINGGKPPGSSGGGSFTDTRLDPSVMAQRRMSDGSIADNQDYSRRILKVTNA